MNGVEVLKAAIGMAHQSVGMVCGDCNSSAFDYKGDGSTINQPGAILAHAVFAEDLFVQGMMQGKQPLYVSDGWQAKTGVPFPPTPAQTPEWAATVHVDMATFNPYVEAVFAATDAYLDSLTDADLDRVLEGGFGAGAKVGAFLAGIGTFHLSQHMGEIAALKGVQGLKGLPF